ncbi:MAG TPA: CerR family C-terminal domain-containing protein [Verrucomicrobiota bacterium]|nr:CerR family C-terminal domain-containing protein [Verrucomicrobiota bacterium]
MSQPKKARPRCLPSRDSAPPTRERVLEAACLLFAEAGFHGTHVREVSKRARASIAGVCYHFRSKEELYEAVILEAGRQLLGLLNQDGEVHNPSLEGPPEQRLRAIIELLFKKLSGERAWIAKLLARELVAPVFTKQVLASYGLERDHILLQGVIRKLLGAEANDKAVRLHTLSVINECLFYCLAGENLNEGVPDWGSRLPDRANLVRHVTRRCLGALEAENRGCA